MYLVEWSFVSPSERAIERSSLWASPEPGGIWIIVRDIIKDTLFVLATGRGIINKYMEK